MSDADLVVLRAGRLEAVLAPDVGGCVASFDWIGPEGRLPVLRGAPRRPGSVLDAGSFPLVPYVNRIRDGRFRFRGREVVQAPNLPPDPSPLHGQGWLGAWQVTEQSPDSAELRFTHPAGEWPWTYEAVQRIALDGGGLTLAIECRNADDAPMPCGLGHHPYFPCTPETRLDTEVRCAWTIDDKVLPVERVPAEGPYDLRDRPICGRDLDNGFGGWGGQARIETPGLPFALSLTSSDADFFQVYSPAAGGLFVAEPVSHANAALNAPEAEWPELGMRVLEPGERMRLTMHLEVEPF